MPLSSHRHLVTVIAAVAVLALVSCSDSDDAESTTDTVAEVRADEGDQLDAIVLPGQRAPATSPAGATSSTVAAPTTTGGGADLTTTSSSTASTTSSTSTSSGATSSTSTTPSPSSTTSTTAPGSTLRFGPTILVDDGATTSSFLWELYVEAAGGAQTASVVWQIDGDSEEVSYNDDGDESVVLRIGSEYWRSDTTGTLRPVNADEYSEERQNILDEVLNTDPGAALDPSDVDGEGLYQMRTSDVATITAVFGGAPPDSADGVLAGQVEVDSAMRVTFWNLEYTATTVGGPTTYLFEGEMSAALTGPIERP